MLKTITEFTFKYIWLLTLKFSIALHCVFIFIYVCVYMYTYICMHITVLNNIINKTQVCDFVIMLDKTDSINLYSA